MLIVPDNSNADAKSSGILTILNSLDALVYVADFKTHEMIFVNRYGLQRWGDPIGKRCYQLLQSGQSEPCAFCTNHLLVDADGKPNDPYVWEFQNTINGQWYQCHDQAIPWIDGRLVRLEIATDITKLKMLEAELEAAKAIATKLSRTDELTNSRNRRALFEDGRHLFDLGKRYRHITAVIMLDIDHFKRVNDRFGHFMGDQVLIHVARLVQDNIREVDLFGRIGGEEFALILPETTLEQAVDAAEKLRLKIADLEVSRGAKTIKISGSFGVATTNSRLAEFEQTLFNADKALYRAKDLGRNRVEKFES